MTDHDTCQILDQVFGICCPKTKIIRKYEFQKTCQITNGKPVSCTCRLSKKNLALILMK